MIFLYYLLENDKVKYVGLTKNLKDRKRFHKNNKPKHIFKIIKTFDNEIEASKAEQHHIKINETFSFGWNKSPGGEYVKSSGYLRKGIGGVKKGSVPWNKDKSGYKLHSEEYKKKLKEQQQGELNKNSKIKEEQAIEIIKTYLSKPNLDGINSVSKNGKKMSYDRKFCLEYCVNYKITPENMERIIKQKSWKKLWSKILQKNV